MKDFYLEELKIYLDREFPEVFVSDLLFLDNEEGRRLFKLELDRKRTRAAISFTQGYYAAFRQGNTDIRSDLTVSNSKNKGI